MECLNVNNLCLFLAYGPDMSVAVGEVWGLLWGYFVFVLLFAFLQA